MQKQWDGSELGLLRNERSAWPSRAAEWERGGRQREGGRGGFGVGLRVQWRPLGGCTQENEVHCSVFSHCPSWDWVGSGPKGIRMELRAWFH